MTIVTLIIHFVCKVALYLSNTAVDRRLVMW